MHYELHDSSGTPLLLLHGGLFDIHQQFGELLPGKFAERPINANHRGGRLKLAHPQVVGRGNDMTATSSPVDLGGRLITT